jgi:hypothetical protein
MRETFFPADTCSLMELCPGHSRSRQVRRSADRCSFMELCPGHSRSRHIGLYVLSESGQMSTFSPSSQTCRLYPSPLLSITFNQKGTASMEDVEMQESGTTTSKKPNLGYCWTHGSSRNRRHTSKTCNDKDAGHQDEATYTNQMGGSTEVQRAERTSNPPRKANKMGISNKVQRVSNPPRNDTTLQPYCWTHGSSKNGNHTSMTCINKHADHQDAATFLDKMGGSTEVNQTLPTSATTPRSYCWTHGFSKNLNHSSMTCIKKDMDHEEEATAANKMGGSTRHEEVLQLRQ